MPTFFSAILTVLLALVVLFSIEVNADPLAPDHVPRADLACVLLNPSQALSVEIDDGQRLSPCRQEHQPKLASNVTGGTIGADVPHDPG